MREGIFFDNKISFILDGRSKSIPRRRPEIVGDVVCDILDEKGKVVQAGMALSEDLSQSGVRIKDRSTFPIDTSIQIHLAVGDEIVDLTGKVRRVQKVSGSSYHIGVEFQELDEDVLKKLIQFYQ